MSDAFFLHTFYRTFICEDLDLLLYFCNQKKVSYIALKLRDTLLLTTGQYSCVAYLGCTFRVCTSIVLYEVKCTNFARKITL